LLGGDITVLRTKEKIDNVFFAYYLSNYKKYELAKYGQGTTIVHLYYNHFKVMDIEIPNFEEQQKIANFLLSIDSSIEKIGNQIDDSVMYKEGLLQKMFV
jgi:type I restriction enzyme S subunit